MNARSTSAGLACEDQLRDLGQPLAVQVQEEGDDPERDDDRQDRPRLAQPLTERDLRDLGRLLLERFDERLGFVMRQLGVESWRGLHRTGPYRTARRVLYRTMVLLIGSTHDCGPDPVPGPSTGSTATRRLPRRRLTPFATGVHSRTR